MDTQMTTDGGRSRRQVRRVAVGAVLALAVVGLAGCQTGQTVWAPCAPAADGDLSGTDGTYVLWCRDGVWEPIMTVTEYLRIMRHEQVTIAPLPPSAPVGLKKWWDPGLTHVVSLTWNAPLHSGGAPADHFVVDWRRADGTLLLHQELPVSAGRGVAVPPPGLVLAPGEAVHVRVQECNVAGCGAVAGTVV